MPFTREEVLNERVPDTAAATPRVGFVGLGWIGRHRMKASLDAGSLVPQVLVDAVGDAIEEARHLAPDAEVFPDLEALLEREDGDLDGLVIATPSALHAEQATLALERGISVFCQKPLGRSANETQAVIGAARKGDRLLGVDLSYRHVRGVELMRQLIQDGEIGDVFASRAVFHNAYGPGKDWFFDRKLSGGGCLIDLGIHLVDLILWTLAFPRVEGIAGHLYRKGEPYTREDEGVEDYATATLELSGGSVAEIACSWNLSTGCDAVIELCFHGTRGSLSLANVNGSYFDFQVERHTGRSREVIAAPPDDWGGRAICAWADRLARRPRFDPEVEHVVQVAEVLDAIYQNSSS